MQLAPGAARADEEVFGEQEALALALLLQGQRPQPASRDLTLLTHGHLDQRAWDPGWEEAMAVCVFIEMVLVIDEGTENGRSYIGSVTTDTDTSTRLQQHRRTVLSGGSVLRRSG